MSMSEPNKSAPPSPEGSGVAGEVCLPLPDLLGFASCPAFITTHVGVSPGSHSHVGQPHSQYAPPACVWPANATELNGAGESLLPANAGDNTTIITTAQRYADTLENFILYPPQKELGAMRRVGLQQAILLNCFNAAKNIEEQTRVLIRLAEIAYGARDYPALNTLSQALITIPFKPAQNAATYYRAVLFKRAGQFDRAASALADLHQPRALLTLATIYENKGEWGEATRLHVEAMRRAKETDAFAFVCAALQLATIRAVDGDHAGSLAEFQSAGPMVRTVAKTQPYLYPLWCNALAVEMAALGRVEEAQAASAVAIASPLAHAYPEWQETAAEIAEQQPSRTVVAVAVTPTEADAPQLRPPLFIQHLIPSPRRLPLAPPSPMPARLLTGAPTHGPPPSSSELVLSLTSE
jgi:tetratricopeptide (TPR) repeat protein